MAGTEGWARRGMAACGLAFLLGAGAAAGVGVLLRPSAADGLLPATSPGPVRSLGDLVAGNPESLHGIDVAAMNLLCATGLPGAEGLDIDRCLARLDEWAARVKAETNRHLYRFREDSADYRRSKGYFRMLMLVTVLQQDLGVHYNKERVRDVDFTNAKDLFIHGLIDDPNGGTCISMPVLYTAVARRLGYPVRLVLAKGHVFCRWDAPEDRVNIEATNQGMNSFDDDYYKTWPARMTTADTTSGRYLRSLTPAEELAVFLAARGHCFQDTGRLPEACVAYAQAHRLDSKARQYLDFLAEAAGLRHAGAGVAGSGVPAPRDPLADLREIEAMNARNRRLTGTDSLGPGPVLPGPRPPLPGGQPSSASGAFPPQPAGRR